MRKKEESNVFETLNSAWNDLPTDITAEERLLFIEIVARFVKLYDKMEEVYEEDGVLKN